MLVRIQMHIFLFNGNLENWSFYGLISINSSLLYSFKFQFSGLLQILFFFPISLCDFQVLHEDTFLYSSLESKYQYKSEEALQVTQFSFLQYHLAVLGTYSWTSAQESLLVDGALAIRCSGTDQTQVGSRQGKCLIHWSIPPALKVSFYSSLMSGNSYFLHCVQVVSLCEGGKLNTISNSYEK